jgi:hypothetical protein
VLRVEDRHRSAFLTGRNGGDDVVGAGGRRDDGTGRVEDRVDDEVQALAGPGRSDDQDRVLDRGPDLSAAATPEQVADILRLRAADRRAKRVASAYERSFRRDKVDVAAGGDALDLVRIVLGAVT